MDDIVKQAMAKWPNVPHCYGWLALDARGNWRMRDEHAQALNLPGDRIRNPALQAFINRNYTHDEEGSWYFQNGPQRVYVNLEVTPYVARTDPSLGLVLHTGEPAPEIKRAWMTEEGQLILQTAEKLALLDDRDTEQAIGWLRIDGRPVDEERFLAWLEKKEPVQLMLEYGGERVPVNHLKRAEIAMHFGFRQTPQPDER